MNLLDGFSFFGELGTRQQWSIQMWFGSQKGGWQSLESIQGYRWRIYRQFREEHRCVRYWYSGTWLTQVRWGVANCVKFVSVSWEEIDMLSSEDILNGKCLFVVSVRTIVKFVRETGSDLEALKNWTFMLNFLSVFRSIEFAMFSTMYVPVLPGSTRA